MKEVNTTPGKTYAVTSPNGCTVTQHVGEVDIATDVPAGAQTLIIAHTGKFEIDDDSAIVTECGGSAELVFTAATTRAASSGTGSDGMTSEERALLMGAAQRDADNTFTAGNTFTGAVDMSGAQVTPPEGWNVEGVTAEQVQAVAPIAFGSWTNKPSATGAGSLTLGNKAIVYDVGGVSIGDGSHAYKYGCAVGTYCKALGGAFSAGNDAYSIDNSISIGGSVSSLGKYAITLGRKAQSKLATSVTIGSSYKETVDGTNIEHTCTTEGTGSITIGAGANTLNNGDVESSNSVTIGCKALNQGADSVVIGAQASGTVKTDQKSGGVTIGAGASNGGSAVVIGRAASVLYGVGVAVGANAQTSSIGCVSIGDGAKATYYSNAFGGGSEAREEGLAIGAFAKALQTAAIAIGKDAKAANKGVVVIASYSEASYRDYTRTQLYFSGANTPLAIEYEDGEAMMGYVVTDKAGNKLAAGTQKLSVLFPNNSTFQSATVDENGEWVMPKVFHPSDLDLPQEEPTEPEEYQPLPVYPIVEPEIPEMEEV